LQERFASRDLDERTLERRHRRHDCIERLLPALVKRVFRIAIIAAQIAKRQADKDAWLTRPGALTLDRVIDLVNR
jgi:hypothetical protein